MSQGKIVQIIGAVVDVEFNRDEVPKIYDALKVGGTEITLEVQQQLGDGVVRTIALGSTDGLKRNLVATNTGKAISVPVGAETLGRIMDVLGNPIDHQLFVMDRKGTSIREQVFEGNPCFLLTDHIPMPKKTFHGLERLGARKLTLGSRMLFASQCVVLIHHELDQREAS